MPCSNRKVPDVEKNVYTTGVWVKIGKPDIFPLQIALQLLTVSWGLTWEKKLYTREETLLVYT